MRPSAAVVGYMSVNFSDFALRPEIMKALNTAGYTEPTPIQARGIPAALEGRDILGLAQTGTGKTAAFALPMLNKLAEKIGSVRVPGQPRALILAPTRELAVQIGDSCRAYAGGLPLRFTTVLGGVSQMRQEDSLQRGVDFVIATPGRLLDLLQQKILTLRAVETLVLDEADRMLDMGFIHDIRRIIAMLPEQRQTMFFSATMSGEVGELARKLLKDPVRIEIAPQSTTAERVEQHVMMVQTPQKKQVLMDLLALPEAQRVIVFTRTKHGADKVEKIISQAGISTGALHGRKTQNARQKVLTAFSRGHIKVLVATDIASRGIDVDDITHVINYELPNEPEIYVHRIGRTARAGRSGVAVSLCAGDEQSYLRQIERLTRQRISIANPPPSSGYKVPEQPRTENRPSSGRPEYRSGGYRQDNRQDTRPEGRGGYAPRGEGRQDSRSEGRSYAPRSENRGYAPRGEGRQDTRPEARSDAPRQERRYEGSRPARPAQEGPNREPQSWNKPRSARPAGSGYGASRGRAASGGGRR